jgi:hypothetical protein
MFLMEASVHVDISQKWLLGPGRVRAARSWRRRYVLAVSVSVEIDPSATDGMDRACCLIEDVRLVAKWWYAEVGSEVGRQGQANFEARCWSLMCLAEKLETVRLTAAFAAASAWSLPWTRYEI